MTNSVLAKVTVNLTVPVQSTWSPEATMAQIVKQAKVDAEGAIRHTFREKYPSMQPTINSMRVTAILAIEGEKD